MTYTFDSQKDGPFEFLNGLYKGSPIVNVVPLQWDTLDLDGKRITKVTKAIIITSP